jgi:hypothetical protein
MKSFLTLVVGIFLISLVSASISVEVDVQDSFGLEEQLSFDYSLLSDVDEQINFIPHILCPNAPVAFLEEQTISLQANIPYTATYIDQVVQDWFEPQTCIAYVRILSPLQKTISKNFTINTNPSFEFDITLEKKVFVQKEYISIDYTSDISGLDIAASLTYPDGRSESVGLPTTIKAGDIGAYEIEVSASKEGYKTIEISEQFAVIMGDAEIGGVVGEGDDVAERNNLLLIIILGIILLILLGVFMGYLILRNKR